MKEKVKNHRSKAYVRVSNGYRVVHLPDHPRAMKSSNWLGYVYEHIMIAEQMLDRALSPKEVVHHLDGNRSNNRIENLLVLEQSQHAKLHMWLDAGAPFSKEEGVQGMNSGKSKVTEPTYCIVCGKTLQKKQKKCCSQKCWKPLSRKVERPSKEELADLLKTTSRVQIGKQFGVSDNAVLKWAKAYKLL